MLKGIDISNHQEGFTVPSKGIDFCICKATEGLNFVDWTCDGFIQQCIKKGLLFGYYHFAHDNGKKEARYFWNNTLGYSGHGIPVIDYEYGSANARSYLESFCEEYHNLSGIWPVVYISALSDIGNVKDLTGSWVPNECGLWLAGYPEYYTSFVNVDCPYDVSPWDFCAIWQFTDNLQMNRWQLDANYAYMTKDAWMKYAGSKTGATPKPAKKKAKTCEQLADEVLAGKWGNGWNRKNALDAAYGAGTYEHVQTIVDERLGLEGC